MDSKQQKSFNFKINISRLDKIIIFISSDFITQRVTIYFKLQNSFLALSLQDTYKICWFFVMLGVFLCLRNVFQRQCLCNEFCNHRVGTYMEGHTKLIPNCYFLSNFTEVRPLVDLGKFKSPTKKVLFSLIIYRSMEVRLPYNM